MDDVHDLHLVPMTQPHLKIVLAIEQQVFLCPWTQRDFEVALSRADGLCRMAMLGNHPVGYAVGFAAFDAFHLAILAIAPPYQRRGFGRRTLCELFGSLDASVCAVSLEVRMSNRAAIALYTGMGFHTVAIQPDYYASPREDALVMVKALRGRFSDWVAVRAGMS